MANSTSIARSIAKLRRVSYGDSFLPSLSYSSAAAISSSLSSSSLKSPVDEERSRWSRWLLFLPGAVSFGLGTWQIFRRQDKVELLGYRQQRLGMEPVNCNRLFQPNKEADSLEFRKVVCRGVFDDEKSIYIGPRSRSISGVTKNGYYLITPLMPIPGDPDSLTLPILVNRGWVPRSWKDNALKISRDMKHHSKGETQKIKGSSWWKFWAAKPAKTIQDPGPTVSAVEVIGVVRGSENPSIFVPENEPNSGQWFHVDVPAIARACGLPEDALYIEDINENVSPGNPYPIPKDVTSLIRISVMPQDHLNYTLTWYSLSAAVTFMAFKRIRPKKSRR